jgi:hypothetical protein
LLVELARRYPAICRQRAKHRALLFHAESGIMDNLEQALLAEEIAERRRDKEYWLPLRQELETLRRAKSKSGSI